MYYVDYEPVKNGEFNGWHLSVVLKKNNDKATFIVMPLTSSPNGDGVNKINIGKITGLPPSIKRLNKGNANMCGLHVKRETISGRHTGNI